MFTFGDLLSDTIDVQVRLTTRYWLLATCYLPLTTHFVLRTTHLPTTYSVLLTTHSPRTCRASLTRAAPSSSSATPSCHTSPSSSRSAARVTRCATRTRAARPPTTTHTRLARRHKLPWLPFALLAPRSPLLAPHSPLLAPHSPLPAPRYSLLSAHYSLLTAHYSLLDLLQRTVRRVQRGHQRLGRYHTTLQLHAYACPTDQRTMLNPQACRGRWARWCGPSSTTTVSRQWVGLRSPAPMASTTCAASPRQRPSGTARRYVSKHVVST